MALTVCLELDDLVKRTAAPGELFDHIVSCYGDNLHAFARRRCDQPDDAAEIYQDALLAAWRYLDTWRGEASLKTWLLRLVATACVRRRRGLKGAALHLPWEETGELADAEPDPETRVITEELLGRMGEFLAALGEIDRAVFMACEVEGRSHQEAAAELGLSVSAVKSRLHRARAALRKKAATFSPPVALSE